MAKLNGIGQHFSQASATMNGALMLRQSLLNEMRESPQVIQRGVLVVLLVGLLVGGVNSIHLVLTTINPEQNIQQVQQAIEEAIDQQAMTANTPQQRVALNEFRKNVEPGIAIWRDVINLPRPLPQPVGVLLSGLGVFVSQPFSYLGGMLLTVVCVHIAASWLGGQGTIQQMIGLGALSVAPHALDALTFIPFLGSMLAMVAWAWGLAILIVATSTVHRLDIGRAIFAVFFFPIIGILLLLLGCCVFFFLAVGLAGAG